MGTNEIINKASLSEQITDALLAEILPGRLQVGERISIDEFVA